METSTPVDAPQRLLSLDVLRGLTIAGMILVTDPGSYQVTYPQLRHAVWNDPTLTDLIFPSFLVIVGVSLTLSFVARLQRGATRRALLGHAFRRGAWLVAIGLLVNGFPFYHLAHLRLPGILQRIGLCYVLASLLYLALHHPRVRPRDRRLVIAAACLGLLALYWALLELYPTPGFGPGRLDSLGSLPAVVDRAVFTVPHLWDWGTTPGHGVTFDPEGLLSTMGALASVLFGVLAGESLRTGDHPETSAARRKQCSIIAVAGVMLWIAGLLLRPAMPINKLIYTPTFALWSSGLALLAFAALFWLIDLLRVRRGWDLLLIFGTNAILAFALSQVITTGLEQIVIQMSPRNQSLHEVLWRHLFTTWLPAGPSSYAYALAIVLLNAALIYPLYRRRIFLRL